MTLFAKDKTQRILALWFPYLPADRILRRRYGPSWRCRMSASAPPLVFSQRDSNTQRIAATDARGESLRLRPGLGIAEARAMHPLVEVIESEPQHDRRMLEALADWCDRYTPLVALNGEDGLYLDITGCAHLFGGEQIMIDDILARFAQQGFEVRGALASTPGAAWAAARFANSSIVAPGAEAELIAPLPLAALRLDYIVRASLESVGLRCAGALMSTPRAPLVRRFGKVVTLRLDQALGRIEEPISPRLPVPALCVERQFFEPISLTEDIERLVTQLARQLKSELERRGEGAERLELQLFRVDGVVIRIGVRASRPLREPRLIQKLFRERLSAAQANIDVGYGFDFVRLAVLTAARFDTDQISLDDLDSDSAGDLALFADRVRARLGERSVSMPELVESHMPERAVRAGPTKMHIRLKEKTERIENRAASKERPIRLFEQPERIDVVAAEIPEGPPSRFRWRQVSYRVASAEGPERIAPEWWQDGESTKQRDYFRIEDEVGRRYWLYREGFYGAENAMPRWYIQGVFA